VEKLLVLLLTLTGMVVFAQPATTVNILPGSCVHIDNCILTMESGNRIWTDNPSFINELSPDGTIIYKCGSGMTYSFKWAGPAPAKENKINVNFSMEAKCTSSDGAIDVNESGYGYWADVRYGGVRYSVGKGTVTLTK